MHLALIAAEKGRYRKQRGPPTASGHREMDSGNVAGFGGAKAPARLPKGCNAALFA